MTSFLLETGADESKVGDVMFIAYEAGSDTVSPFSVLSYIGGTYNASQSVSSISTFILAMCNYPEVQAKAQAEIDAAVGADRLPDFSDRENLPYVNAIILETLRWHPVAPIGMDTLTLWTNAAYKLFFRCSSCNCGR